MGGVSFNVAAKTKTSKKRGGRRRKTRVPRVLSKYNPQPVFTETVRLQFPGQGFYQLGSNSGGILTASMDVIPQLAQYTALYRKYRILKAQFICLATYPGSNADVNTAIYNNSVALQASGMGRLVFAVNNSPNVPIPTAELDVLQCNGSMIKIGKPKIVVSCKPVPDLQDLNGVRLTQRTDYINFESTNVVHRGITWWYTMPTTTTILDPFYAVYCKLTFQLADPR